MDYGVDTWVPALAMAVVLGWGLRLLTNVFTATKKPNVSQSVLMDALSEKSAPDKATSFSRVSGAIGSVAIASFFAGLGFWIFFAINNDDASVLGRIESLSTYFLGGAALFSPYAFNQVSRIFGGK